MYNKIDWRIRQIRKISEYFLNCNVNEVNLGCINLDLNVTFISELKEKDSECLGSQSELQ